MSHVNDRPEQYSVVSDINAASALAMLSFSRENAAAASLVSPPSPPQKPTKSMNTIISSSTQGRLDNLAAQNARSCRAGSYERKDSAVTKPLPKNLPVVPKERHIPAHKKKTCALTFPERLMSMLDYADEMKAKSDDPDNYCVTWLPEGGAFLVRDPKACAETVIPKFFKAVKFSSFARKLYRWGFHQIQRQDADAPSLPAGAIIFASEHFKRDARHEMVKMRSITVARQKRKADQIEGMDITITTGGSSLKEVGNSNTLKASGSGGLSTSNLLIASGVCRGSVSSMSGVTTQSANSMPPLKKRTVEIMTPSSSNQTASCYDSSTIAQQSNAFLSSSAINGNNNVGKRFLHMPSRQPTSADGMKINDQVLKLLSLMNQNGMNQVTLPPAQLDSRLPFLLGDVPLLPARGMAGGYPLMRQSSMNQQQIDIDYFIRLFRSAADTLEKTGL